MGAVLKSSAIGVCIWVLCLVLLFFLQRSSHLPGAPTQVQVLAWTIKEYVLWVFAFSLACSALGVGLRRLFARIIRSLSWHA